MSFFFTFKEITWRINHAIEIKISFTKAKNAPEKESRKRGEVEEAAWSDLPKENDNLSPSGMKQRMKKERKKFVIWQHFGNNHDVPFTTAFSDYIFAKLGADLHLTTAVHGDTQSCQMWNVF